MTDTKRDTRHKRSERADDIFNEVDEDIGALERTTAVKRGKAMTERLEKAMHRLNKLEMLMEITKALNSTLNLNEVLEKILDSVINLADTDRGFLMLSNRNGEMEFRIARDRKEQPLEKDDFEVSYSIIDDVVKKARPLFIPDVLQHAQFKEQESVLDLNLRTAVCLPLTLNSSIIGVIYTDSNRLAQEMNEDDMSIITAFASQAAIAIENARLHGELILSRENLARENLELKQELSEKYEFSGIIGKSKPMLEIFNTIKKVAPLSSTVLIQGDTGTGKELIARAIHFHSPRKTEQLITINCGAMPENLLETELFGHKKGAFTGAYNDKAGLFETASGGTIFLDEIGDMPLPLQVKLLRALQEGEIRRVGENLWRTVDVRVIAATNRDLSDDIKKGSFRQDLYYRLNVVPIHIPPLRERRDDILPLTEHFLEKYSTKLDKKDMRILPEAVKLLLNNQWKGNVRELENTIERALALSGDSTVLSVDHFPQLREEPDITEQLEGRKTLKEKLRAVERKIIIETLEKTNWKITKSAEILEVTRQHLHNKIKQHQIKPR